MQKISENNMAESERFTEKQAIKLLEKYAPDKESLDNVLWHSKAVQKAALKLMNDIDCNWEFIKTACLVHDIGRFNMPPKKGPEAIKHGIEGAKILKKEGWPKKFQKVCENHIGIGIRKQDIEEQNLPLPLKDYIPETKEEKIIAYADNLVKGNKIVDETYVVERFKKELGEKYGKRVEKFHEEIRELK